MQPLHGLAQRLSQARWFTAVGKWPVALDAALQRRTNARLSLLRLAGVDSLLLTTTGRRSGRERTVPLQYLPYEGGYVIVGSNWGGPEHPGWSANLLASPVARVAVRGKVHAVGARLAVGDERARLWAVLTARWPGYARYQERAGREIRVFVLTPSD